jgi:hypothetical protein
MPLLLLIRVMIARALLIGSKQKYALPSFQRKEIVKYSAYMMNIPKKRHLIACFFGKIKHFRRIFSRFNKAASTFLAFLSFVGALIWLRSFCSQNLEFLSCDSPPLKRKLFAFPSTALHVQHYFF